MAGAQMVTARNVGRDNRRFLSREHARLFSAAGWGKSDLWQFLFDHAVRTRVRGA
jgi:hypothetical protein